MINIKDFLNKTEHDYTYALITYNDKTEPTHFSRFNFGHGNIYMHSPCVVTRICKVDKDIEKFCEEAVEVYVYDSEEEKREIIENYIKPMIVDNIFYDLDCPMCMPYLPEEVEDIKIITERECLLYLLNNQEF